MPGRSVMLRVGIDNGLDGAIVVVGHDRRLRLAHIMPTIQETKTRRSIDCAALWDILIGITTDPDCFAVQEFAQAMPRQGASSGFTYGMSVGAVRACLCASRIPFAVVTPGKWQRGMLGKTTAGDKAQHVAAVRRLLPEMDLTPGKLRKPHDGLADAALMALWAWELRPGR